MRLETVRLDKRHPDKPSETRTIMLANANPLVILSKPINPSPGLLPLSS
jgi:hypothetical protein